jgi:hypothetical protein
MQIIRKIRVANDLQEWYLTVNYTATGCRLFQTCQTIGHMTMTKGFNFKALRTACGVAALLAAAFAPMSAEAHRQWLKPSAAQVEGKAPWVTVDAASSEGIFDFDHMPVRLDGLAITGPDGQPVEAQNKWTGKMRSAFDVELKTPGTYRISVVTAAVMGSYTLNGETKRFRGTEADYQSQIPQGAADVRISRNFSRIETFASANKPNDTVLAPAGKGLEVVPLTHPSELFVGEAAKFRFLLDGKPLAGLSVTVIPDGGRFRNGLKEIVATTDAAGEVSVTWELPGYHLLTASYPPRRQGGEGQGGQGATAGPPDMPAVRYSYAATFEVLAN